MGLNNLSHCSSCSILFQKSHIITQGSTLAWRNQMLADGNGGEGAERASPLPLEQQQGSLYCSQPQLALAFREGAENTEKVDKE